MKDVELKLLRELMKNSRRSDRDLAKAVGVSQPTISRTIKKLEKEGVIKEYTIVPDFAKLGFELMAVTMYKLRAISPEELEELQEAARELDKQKRRPYLLVMDGYGLGKNLVVVSFHRTYSDYASYMRSIRETATSGTKAYMNLENIESFLIDLNYKKHYQPITFSKMAAHLEKMTSNEQ